MAYTRIPYQNTVDFCRRVFAAYGFSAEESEQITDVLLTADLYGIESHGIQRLVRYHQEITGG
ncbi:MAG TPA: malate dehydrogenase, partial [Clostridiales bacterium]|nr:malate dehydrogenase [Clostridiales bacterium]